MRYLWKYLIFDGPHRMSFSSASFSPIHFNNNSKNNNNNNNNFNLKLAIYSS